jgi:hypothetical protein
MDKKPMKKFLIAYCHNVQIDWFTAYASYLKENHNIPSLCIVQGKEDYNHAISLEIYDYVHDILDNFDYKKADISLKENLEILRKLEEQQNESTFFRDVYQDRWLMGKYSYEYIIHFAAHITQKLEKYFNKYPPLVAVGEKNSLPYRIFHHYSQILDFPHYTHLAVRHFPTDKFYLEPDIYWRWPKLIEFYKKYLAEGIPEEYVTIANDKYNEIVTAHLNSEKKLIIRGGSSLFDKLKLKHLGEFFTGLFNTKDKYANPRTFKTTSTIERIKGFVKTKKARNFFDSIALKEFDLSRKFCAYFLHLQPEYTIDGLGFGYSNQLELIRTIAASIPADHVLLVKEHRVAIGKRSEEFYSTIKNYPNVCLISDEYDGHLLIENASILFTVTGSVALEAMYHQKPTIAFGEIFYKAFKGITSVKDVRDELRHLIQDMVKYPDKYTADKENALAVIAAMWHAGHEGCFNPIFIPTEEIHKSPNKEKVGKGLANELRYLELL